MKNGKMKNFKAILFQLMSRASLGKHLFFQSIYSWLLIIGRAEELMPLLSEIIQKFFLKRCKFFCVILTFWYYLNY